MKRLIIGLVIVCMNLLADEIEVATSTFGVDESYFNYLIAVKDGKCEYNNHKTREKWRLVINMQYSKENNGGSSKVYKHPDLFGNDVIFMYLKDYNIIFSKTEEGCKKVILFTKSSDERVLKQMEEKRTQVTLSTEKLFDKIDPLMSHYKNKMIIENNNGKLLKHEQYPKKIEDNVEYGANLCVYQLKHSTNLLGYTLNSGECKYSRGTTRSIFLFSNKGIIIKQKKYSNYENKNLEELLKKIKKASKSKKPIILVGFAKFTNKWDTKLKNSLKDQQVLKIINDEFTYIIYEDGENLKGTSLEMYLTPTTWFLDYRGNPYYQEIAGFMDKEKLLRALKVVLEESKKGK